MNLFRNLKSRLHIDKKLFKKAKYEVLKLIKTKKRDLSYRGNLRKY